MQRALTGGAVMLLALVLAACGGSSSKTASSSTSASSAAGHGKPAVTIGDKNFSEENILGSLYAQALRAQGYTVTEKDNIGSSEITFKALKSGQIDMYPEYTGTLLTAIAGQTRNPTSAAEAYSQAAAYASTQGLQLLAPTPFSDSDALATLPAFASKHHLSTIADLKPLGKSLKLAAAPEFATRYEGLIGLRQAYGVNPTFVPLAIGLDYNALDRGQVQVADVFTTDGQLQSGKYVLLSDPKGVFGYQNVAPVVSSKVLQAEGPAFSATINKVSALLTLPAIQKMNAAVTNNKLPPATVARQFLAANHLL